MEGIYLRDVERHPFDKVTAFEIAQVILRQFELPAAFRHGPARRDEQAAISCLNSSVCPAATNAAFEIGINNSASIIDSYTPTSPQWN